MTTTSSDKAKRPVIAANIVNNALLLTLTLFLSQNSSEVWARSSVPSCEEDPQNACCNPDSYLYGSNCETTPVPEPTHNAGGLLLALVLIGGVGAALASGGGESSDNNDNVQMVIVPPVNIAPIITSDDNFTVTSNIQDVSVVMAVDPDTGPSPVSFSITGGEDAGFFQIQANSGALSFISPPDAGDPQDFNMNNTYLVEVTAFDGALSTSQLITVEVTCPLVLTTNDGLGINSLRDAVICANTNGNGADTITLGAGQYNLTLTGDSEDAAMEGDLDILDDLTIIGAGINSTFIDATNLNDVIFHLPSSGATLRLENLTIQNSDDIGILVDNSNIELVNVRITGNEGSGVLLNNSSTGHIENSMIDHNGSTVIAGSGVFVLAGSEVLIENTTISYNLAEFGGGVHTSDSVTTINNSLISNNTSNMTAGGINSSDSTLSIYKTSILNNMSEGAGGIAIYGTDNVMIDTSTIDGNVSLTDGSGGITSFSFDTVDIINSTISNNTANGFGAGAILLDNGNDVLISNSTITGNIASPTAPFLGTMSFAHSGPREQVDIINTTLSNNIAPSDVVSLSARQNVDVSITNSTIYETLNTTGVLIHLNANSGISLQNTIVYGSSAVTDIAKTGPGGYTSLGHNIISADDFPYITPAIGDMIGTTGSRVNPLLSALADNGGPTYTHALMDGSPALDAGANIPGLLTTDQRGADRVQFNYDIGAYERVNDIGIEKYVNGEIADVGSGPDIPVGDNVAFLYAVTNFSHDQALLPSMITIIDDNGTPGNPADDFMPSLIAFSDQDNDNVLDPGETWYYTANAVATLGVNGTMAEITAQFSNVNSIDSDWGIYTGV